MKVFALQYLLTLLLTTVVHSQPIFISENNGFYQVTNTIISLLRTASKIAHLNTFYMAGPGSDFELSLRDSVQEFHGFSNMIASSSGSSSELTDLFIPRQDSSLLAKHSGSETIVVIFVSSWAVIPRLFGRDNADTRYYVFYQLEYSDGLLNSKNVFPLRNKVELVLVKSDSSVVQIRQLCFYCDGGLPKRLRIQEALNFNEMFPDFISNMNGSVLQAASSNGLEFSMNFKTTADGKVVLDGGFSNQLLLLLQQRHKFRYNVTLRPVFGKRAPNGTFNGFLKLMQAGTAEYTMEIAAILERSEVLIWLPITHFANLLFFTRAPSQFATNWKLIVQPFESILWVVLSISMLVLCLVVSVIILMSHSKMGEKPKKLTLWGKGVDHIIRPMLDQGVEDTSWDRDELLKIVAGLWLFCAMILSTAYRAKLTVLRSQRAEEDIPRTFAELEASDYEIYLHYVGGSFIKSFEGALNPTHIAVRKRFIFEKNVSKCFENVIHRRAACVTTDSNGIVVQYKNFSSVSGQPVLAMAKDFAFTLLSGPAASKNAPFAPAFAKTTQELVDTGVIKRIQYNEGARHKHNGKAWAKTRVEQETWRHMRSEGPQPIVLEEMIGIFFVCAFSATISFAVFMAEKFRLVSWVSDQKFAIFVRKVPSKLVHGTWQSYRVEGNNTRLSALKKLCLYCARLVLRLGAGVQRQAVVTETASASHDDEASDNKSAIERRQPPLVV